MFRRALRAGRYGLPHMVERLFSGPGADKAARLCTRLHRRNLKTTVGYFQADTGTAREIIGANCEVARLLAGCGDACLAIKAPPLHFDSVDIAAIAECASAASLPMLFDAHAPKDADATLDIVEDLLGTYPGTGFALPARWRRSMKDAERFRDADARIRIVKGEWRDPDADEDPALNYLALVERLAGRSAPVGVATHDPDLAACALTMLRNAGTPCELEQLRGLPSRRTRAVATRVGVPIRIYVPFGPGWWPYAMNKIFERPYLPLWIMRDLMGR